MLCPGFPALTVVRSTDAARAFTLPWGTEGDKVEVAAAHGAADGRNQAFFVLMAGAATRSRAQRRSSGQQYKEGLTAFPLWVGRERQRPGGNTPSPGSDLLAAGRYRFRVGGRGSVADADGSCASATGWAYNVAKRHRFLICKHRKDVLYLQT